MATYPPGLPAPHTPVAKSSGDQIQMTPSKKRRDRLVRSTQAKADTACYHAASQTDQASDERLMSLEGQMKSIALKVKGIDEVKSKVDNMEKATKGMTKMLEKLLNSGSRSSISPPAPEEASIGSISSEMKDGEQKEEDLLDSIYCSSCNKIAYVCSCKQPSFETAVCLDGDCGLQTPVMRLQMADLSKMRTGHNEFRSWSQDDKCIQCGTNGSEVTLNALENEFVCEQAFWRVCLFGASSQIHFGIRSP
jgi:hypothetical protein